MRTNTPTISRRPSQPIEVGVVTWNRDLDDALEQARHTGKPVFALFQEVPGCAGCKQFGADVLSNPTLVDAIEHEFVPLLIHNNAPGRDAEVLAAYGEPSWNFQVVRFLDAHGHDVIPRRDRVWETGPLAARMIDALATAGRAVPTYLRLLEQEHSDRLDTIDLAQPCFWVGEAEIGSIDGVVATEAGFVDGREVTRVLYDMTSIDAVSLVRVARERDVATHVYASGDAAAQLAEVGIASVELSSGTYRRAPDADQKRNINGRLRPVELSPAQATKLNSFLPKSLVEGTEFIAPHQRDALGWGTRLRRDVDV